MKSITFSPEVVEIQRIAPGGDGVARLSSGEAIFVPVTAPGDRVEILNAKRVSSVLTAEKVRVLTPGPDRCAPACPFSETCGGCDFMHLSKEAQRREKLAMLDDALTRIGGNVERPKTIGFVPSEDSLGYRARLRLRVDKLGNVGYLAARSNRMVIIDRCLVAVPLLNEVLTTLSGLDEASRRRLSFCDQIELRAVDGEPKLSVRLHPRKGTKLRAEIYANLFPSGALVTVADSPSDKELCQSLTVTPEVALKLPVGAFSQVNYGVNRKLVSEVVSAAVLRGHKTFVDAYAGAGNFALPLLKAGLTGESVDLSEGGILAARGVARDLGLPFSGFTIGDARQTLERFAKSKRRFEYVVLDPPRRGANKDVVELALRLRPSTIALVGCDPVSLSRDVGLLVNRGATVESLTVFDMFPETHHSETLAILDTGIERQ